jgi:pimeloyl-ACP methyl ester carboxylesterase
VLLVAGLASLAYLPTLKYGFVWDDRALIVDNQDLDAPSPARFFGQSFTHWWAKKGLVPDAYYRPLVMTSFWLDHKAWGTNPYGFHLTNVLLNTIASVLVAALLVELLGRSWPAFVAGLVFALHPAHVESVAFVSGRTDVMMAVFVLLAFLALGRYRRKPGPAWMGAVVMPSLKPSRSCATAGLIIRLFFSSPDG